jgi:ADP-heptose:LPS heptosyltransferase
VTPGDGRPALVALRALGLGDLLAAVPALRALRRGFPGHRITVATPAPVHPLVALTGAADEMLDAAPLAPLAGVDRPEVAVNLHGSGPESDRVLLALAPRRLIAFACAGAGVPDGPAWDDGEHEVARWCRLLRAHGIPADPGALDLPPPPLAPALAGLAGATVIHPGASSGARRWPAERFAAVARAEAARGRRVVVTGSAGERALAEAVAAGADLSADAVRAGRTDVLGLAALVAHAGRVVCGDTGVAHLATAFRTPSVVVFGPISPALWGPPADRPEHVALWAGRPGDPHADRPAEGLLAIGVGDVLAALARLDGRPGRVSPRTRAGTG